MEKNHKEQGRGPKKDSPTFNLNFSDEGTGPRSGRPRLCSPREGVEPVFSVSQRSALIKPGGPVSRRDEEGPDTAWLMAW